VSDTLASEAGGADFSRGGSSLKSIFKASSNAWNAVSSIDSLVVFFAMRLRLVTYSPGIPLYLLPPADRNSGILMRDIEMPHGKRDIVFKFQSDGCSFKWMIMKAYQSSNTDDHLCQAAGLTVL
jgi:hypothetical protein